MSIYRKKPVEIEAKQFKVDAPMADVMDIYQWVESYIGSVDPYGNTPGVTIAPENGAFVIKTLEGDMTVSDRDWVIRGVQGEFYPCKPDIFAETYELVSDD